jgi:hypothetical protein
VHKILCRHDNVAETLARPASQYRSIFMHDDCRIFTGEWTLGLICGLALAADAWAPIMLSIVRSKLAPIFFVHPYGQRRMPAMPNAELDRIKSHTHELIGAPIVALHKPSANDRDNAPRQNSQQDGCQA